MTLREKCAQLVCSDIYGDVSADDPRVEQWLELAGVHGIGGFVLYGGTPESVVNLLNLLQERADVPILISSDFEGGAGQQVAGASEFPGNMAFDAACDPDLMYRAAKIMAAEGRSMGIHLSYSPVTDLSIDPDNPQESVRSFGGDVDMAGQLTGAYIRAFHEEGMLATSKHFPGRGNMKADKANPGFNMLDASARELDHNEFKAIKYAVDAGVDFIMTEHIAVPAVTKGSVLPASMEPCLATDIIRGKLGFTGIVTTDDLWYDHVVARFGAEEAAVKAILAGHDIVLKPQDPVAAIDAIARAVAEGRITKAQIDGSVRKLLQFKARLGLHRSKFADKQQVSETVGTPKNTAVVREVADSSVTLLRNEGVLPIKDWKGEDIVHIAVQKEAVHHNAGLLEAKLHSHFPGIACFTLGPDTGGDTYRAIREAVGERKHAVVSFFVQRTRFGESAPLREADIEIIQSIITARPGQMIAVSYGNPHIITKIPDVSAFLVCYGEGGWYGNQSVYFDSFIDIMNGKLRPSGKLPLQVGRNYPIGFGITY